MAEHDDCHLFPDTHTEADHAQGSSADVARAKPVVYVSTSEGLITDWAAYSPEGSILFPDELPVIVVQIDWDDVSQAEGPDEWPVKQVRAWTEDERLPKRLRDDIALSLLDSRRFDIPDDDDE